ncbi:metallophosphoesterase family protein [Pontiella agarivorans]|uniref:Metallophosphoesterase family protein n=1 Tax=Pontiella agarivorans TaxID=3038953 RepID=A0ABU5N095_9BACT|nr:metallophosphoesterase family protein [Pontiella agarivorans]MDZ8119848.1 metallophosphoesterase family protein [Pontiella agarivorans]
MKRSIVLAALLTSSALAHIGEHSMRHWEIPSPDPDRIFLTFHGDPATSRAVTWRTDQSVEQAFAEIAPALGEPGFIHKAMRIKARTETVDLSQIISKDREPVHYHSVIFQDLEPESLYAYRVGDGKNRWSEWIQFKTASDKEEDFRFVYFGDAQNDVFSRWSRVIRMAHQTAPDAAFALHAGDLINHANADPERAGWFKAGSYLHAQWTGVPVIGNHEYNPVGGANRADKTMSALWQPQFTLPTDESLPDSLKETVYSFDYQGARFIILNSCAENAVQTRFLEKELKKPGARWKIVSFHHPIFAPGGRSNYKPEDREAWRDLFAEYNVDLVLQGHDHSYLRGQVPTLGKNGQPEDDFKTLYVVSVSGPKQYPTQKEFLKQYEPEHYEPVRRGENSQFFQVIEVGNDELVYEAYIATGERYDRAVIRKNHRTGKKKIRQDFEEIEQRTMINTIEYSKKDL